jgi:hypothetical protein
LAALRSRLQRMSSANGVSGPHSLPDFRPRSANDSGALRRSRATGARSEICRHGRSGVISHLHEHLFDVSHRRNKYAGSFRPGYECRLLLTSRVHLVQMVPPQRSRLLFTDWIFTVSCRRGDFSDERKCRGKACRLFTPNRRAISSNACPLMINGLAPRASLQGQIHDPTRTYPTARSQCLTCRSPATDSDPVSIQYGECEINRF